MSFTLSNAIREACLRTRQLDVRKATAGATTSMTDTSLVGAYSADDLLYGTLLVIRDAGGAGAAPEGEFNRISAYDDSTFVATVDTAFTAAIAAGDKVGIIPPNLSLETYIELANSTLIELGDIALVDATLTTLGSPYHYTLPLGANRKNLIAIYYADSSGNWYPVSDYNIIPAAPGTAQTLILPALPTGLTLNIVYHGVHSALTAYNSVISATIPPMRFIAKYIEKIYEYQVRGSTQEDPVMLRSWVDAKQEAYIAENKLPIWKPATRPTWFRPGDNESFYPGDPTYWLYR